MYLPDTNVFIRVMSNCSIKLLTRWAACDPKEIFVSSIVQSELLFGAHNSQHVEANLNTPEQFLKPHSIHSLPTPTVYCVPN